MKNNLMETSSPGYAPETPDPVERATCDWKLAAVSQRGSSHEIDGRPCQDSFSLAMVSEGILVIAVADGAGSARLAEVGSDLAVRTSSAELCRQLPPLSSNLEAGGLKEILIQTINTVRAALEAEAIRRDVPAREFATTLLLVIATPDLVAAAQVGDGAVIVGDKGGEIIGLTVPLLGEYINEVVFVTSGDAVQSAQVAIRQGKTTHVAVLSDGLQMLCLEMPQCAPHQAFFSPLFKFISEEDEQGKVENDLSTLLNSQRVRDLTDDDMTLVLASLRN